MYWYCLILLLLLIIIDILLGMRAFRLVATYPGEIPAERNKPALKVSVVALALSSEENPDAYLERIYSQDYPDFEVILVCDCNAETAAMHAERLARFPNLHITFLPRGSRRLSRRKLALTIGIKAAKGQVVLTTSTSLTPLSDSWLSAMMIPFNAPSSPDSPLPAATLGVVALNPGQFDTFAGRNAIFNWEEKTIRWLGAAIGDSPTRCDGFNMAFRKDLFFKLKGYSSSMLLIDGEDDLFLRDLAAEGKCIPVLTPDSVLLTDWGEDSQRILTEYREQYLFTRRFLPKLPYFVSAFSSACRWLALLLCIFSLVATMILLPAPEGLYCLLPPLLLIAYAILQTTLYRRAGRRISPTGRPLPKWSVPFRLLWLPLSNIRFKISHGSSAATHYVYKSQS